MLFKKKFKVVEIHANGVVVTTYLHGKTKDVNEDVEYYKKNSTKYEMVSKNAMIVWA